MPFQLIQVYAALPAFALVLARVAGIVLAAPFFSGTAIPVRIKTALVVAITVAVFPMMVGYAQVPVNMTVAMGGLLGELALGLLIGFSVSAVFMGVQLGIQLASQQAGIALGEVFNPMLESSLPVAAQIYFFVTMMIFLVTGGHHAVIRSMLDSFQTVPLMGFRPDENVVALMIDILTIAFRVAVRVGGPMTLALLLGLMTLGFVSRTIPQLNILSVGFPVKAAIVLVVMALTIMSVENVLLDSMTQTLNGVRARLGLPAI